MDLSGYFLTDTLSDPTQWSVPRGTTIPARDFRFIWADQENGQNGASAELHANFKLSRDGEAIALFSPNGTAVDAVFFGRQTNDISQGRFPDGADGFYFMSTPSPGAVNQVRLSNTAPVLQPFANLRVDELNLLTLTAVATDADAPAQTLVFSLGPEAPTGATITAAGRFRWRPTEAQGPGAYAVTIRVTDSGVPPLSASQTFRVTVREVNRPPEFLDAREKFVKAGSLLSFLTAADPDLPRQTVKFDFEESVPSGANVHFSTGRFTWRPTKDQAPADYSIAVKATDEGSPRLSASHRYLIHVLPAGADLIQMDLAIAGGRVELTWTTVVGEIYQVEHKAGLAADWQPLPGNLPAAGDTLTAAYPLEVSGQGFYRVKLVR